VYLKQLKKNLTKHTKQHISIYWILGKERMVVISDRWKVNEAVPAITSSLLPEDKLQLTVHRGKG
jgi:hypothetical protein